MATAKHWERKKRTMFRIGNVYECAAVCLMWCAHTYKRPVFVFIQIRVYSFAWYSLFYRWKMFETNGNECKAWIDTLRAFNSIYADIGCLNSWAIERSHETSSLIWNSFDLSLAFYLSFFLSYFQIVLSFSHSCSISSLLNWFCGWSIASGVHFLCLWFYYFQFYLKAHTRSSFQIRSVPHKAKQSKTNQPIIKSIYWYSIEFRAARSENCLIA